MKRIIDPIELLSRRSHFLFGPRGTGKSFLIRHADGDRYDTIDLLRSDLYLELQRDPSALESFVTRDWVVIDEVQRIPEILNEVHRLIEEKGKRFLLTGSSARKLRRGGTNLLAGRAFKSSLFGLTWAEISREQRFDLDRYLLFGGLPTAYLEDHPADYLLSYTQTYLREEIQAEALVKNLPNYNRFLFNAACASGEMLNFTSIASDAQLSPSTVRDYYQVLEDTLLGQVLPPWTMSRKRKAIQTAKFYFFDIGVVHSLKNITALGRNSSDYGTAFEHFIFSEIRAALAYLRSRDTLRYWRSKNNQEVDFVIGEEVAIEVKAAKRASERDHRGLNAIGEEKTWKDRIVVSQDPRARRFASGIRHLHWSEFLESLWQGDLFS